MALGLRYCHLVTSVRGRMDGRRAALQDPDWRTWTDDRSSDGGIYPEPDFRAWYLDWLGDQP